MADMARTVDELRLKLDLTALDCKQSSSLQLPSVAAIASPSLPASNSAPAPCPSPCPPPSLGKSADETSVSEAPGPNNAKLALAHGAVYEGRESLDAGALQSTGAMDLEASGPDTFPQGAACTGQGSFDASEGPGPVHSANAFAQGAAYEGYHSFDGGLGDFHGSYAAHHGVYHNYTVPPFYDQAYMHPYNPYAFQGDYTFVNQSFPSEFQFAPSQGNISYGYPPSHVFQYHGYPQEPVHHAFQHYSPYSSPLHAGGVVMLDGQEDSQPNINSFTGQIPPLTLPPGGMVMLDPSQPGVICSNACASMNNVTGSISGLEQSSAVIDSQASLQPPAQVISNLNAAAGPFTPAFVIPLVGAQTFDKPLMTTYPAYQDVKNMPTPEVWDASGNLKGSHSGFFYPQLNSLQSCGPLTAVCLPPETSGYTKGRAPLLDVTTNYNVYDEQNIHHNSNGVLPAKNRLMRRGRNGFYNNNFRSRVEWTPVSKNVEGTTSELEVKKLEPCSIMNDHQQYNRSDFVTEYEDAKHFIIKSFSEANVRQSVKYRVWSSTHNGNKKLDQAYEEAQSRAKGKANGCPVFLFFSVNGSGQFCGVAEMAGCVDYTKTMDCWDRVRWSGSFPVKWHIIKNVPNFQLHGIILQDNENKPVTNSRDTQEVNYQQGLQMLSIFKKYYARSWILDDCNIHQSNQMNYQDSPPKYQPKIYQVVTKEEQVTTPESKEETRDQTSG